MQPSTSAKPTHILTIFRIYPFPSILVSYRVKKSVLSYNHYIYFLVFLLQPTQHASHSTLDLNELNRH